MNWDNIRVFLAVANTGSVSAASRELEVNHSTVLRRIQALEDELGVKLFNREARGYVLTSIAEQILDSAVMMDQDANALQRQIQMFDAQPSGRLHIAMPPGTCADLMPVLQQFRAKYPDIELLLDSQSALHNLDKMEADVAIRLTLSPPEHYRAIKLFEMPFRVYGHTTYLARQGVIAQPSDVDWVCYEMPSINVDMAAWLREQDAATQVVVTVNTLALTLQAVENGMGVGFLPEHVAQASPQLQRIEAIDYHFSFPVYLLAHRDLYYQPRVKRFVEFAAERMANYELAASAISSSNRL